MATKQPNILFILVDDLGWRDTGFYGSSFYETPNIDKLCSESLTFTDAYAACPVCSPTRASILTGKYPATVGVTNYIDWKSGNHPAKGKLVDVSYFRELPLTERSLARSLRNHGYATWHVGKWHLGDKPCYPEHHGFELNIGGCAQGTPGKNGHFSPWNIESLRDVDVPPGTYLSDYLTDKAIELLRSHASEERPFFLNLWYYAVHAPVQGKPEKVEKYKQKAHRLGLDKEDPFETGNFYPAEHLKDKRIRRRKFQSDPSFAAMVETLDDNVGRVLTTLDELQLSDNTLVIFTSDNGGLNSANVSPTSNAPLSEGKGWMYEGGVREPLAVRWPGTVEPGRKTDALITSPDFYPTLLDVAGIPQMPDQHCDGESFYPLLCGESWQRSAPLFWHYPHYGNAGSTPGCSIRKGDWKLLEFFEDEHVELYNLRDDIGETNDRSADEPGIASDLVAELHAWQKRVLARKPTANPDYVPWDKSEPSGHSSTVRADALRVPQKTN